jgi:hypothetical protein
MLVSAAYSPALTPTLFMEPLYILACSAQYQATQIGKIEGEHAKMYSGSMNNVGVKAGE